LVDDSFTRDRRARGYGCCRRLNYLAKLNTLEEA
jgi:hypothetical protein